LSVLRRKSEHRKTYHRAILPILGTALAVAVSCAAAVCSIGMAVPTRDDVAKSLWRRSGAMRDDISADDENRGRSSFLSMIGIIELAAQLYRL
jgi:hypothetical protein